MSERVRNQRAYIRNLKIRKRRQLLAQQELQDTPQRSRRAIQAEENRRQRRAGTRRLRQITRNQHAARCRHCINDDCPPHSNRRSTFCHAHVVSVAEAMKNILGESYQLRVRKAILLRSLSIQAGSRKIRGRLKKAIAKEVNRVVDWLRDVTIKAQNFLQYYVLHKFSEGQDLLPSIFTPNCVYGFMQLIVGRPITNTDDSMPQDREEIFNAYRTWFNDINDCTVPNFPGYSSCFSYMKDTIATANMNAIVETFRLRAETYLAFCLRQIIPHEHFPGVALTKKICSYLYTQLAGIELEDEPDVDSEDVTYAIEYIASSDGLLGPTPVNLETLKSSPHVYAKIIWSFLNEMETAEMGATDNEIVDKCDMAWLRIRLKEFDTFNSLTRRKQKMILRSVLQIINGDDPDFQIRYQLEPAFVEELTHIINNTRNQLERSKLFLNGRLMIDPATCFKSGTASFTRSIKLFSLLPSFTLQRKFVTFNTEQWRHVLRICGVRFEHDNRNELGILKIQEDLWTFAQTLNFDKVGLGSSLFHLEQYNVNAPPENIPYVFDNTIRTDGHTIEFLYGISVSEFDNLPDLTMPDLSNEELEQFHVYGIDPGHRHLVSAVDIERSRDVQENQNCVRFSNNEWYHKAGVMRRRSLQQEKKKDEGITNIESNLLPRKTSDPENFALCSQPLFDNLTELTRFYGSSFTNDRFLNYIGQQKMANELVNLFVSGDKKYNHRIRDDQRIPLLLLGSKGRNSIRGKKQSMASKAIKALKRAESEGLLIVCEVNEDYSSKVCHLCLQQSNEQKKVQDRFSSRVVSLWGVLECNICHHNWDRDYNACHNILYLGLREHASLDRPAVFSHRQAEPTTPPSPSLSSSSEIENNTVNISDNDPMDVDLDITPSQQLTFDFTELDL